MLLSKLARRLLIPCCRNPGDEELQDRRLWTCSTNISVCMAMLSHCVRNGWRCSRRTSPTPPRPASNPATSISRPSRTAPNAVAPACRPPPRPLPPHARPASPPPPPPPHPPPPTPPPPRPPPPLPPPPRPPPP